MNTIYAIMYEDGTIEGNFFDTLEEAVERISRLDDGGDPIIVQYKEWAFFDRNGEKT